MMGGQLRLVGHGIVTPNTMVHGRQLTSEQVSVNVRSVVVPFAPLEWPTDESMSLIGQAVGSFAIWRRTHVGPLPEPEVRSSLILLSSSPIIY